MAKKVWTAAARKAFALKMKRARAAVSRTVSKRRRRRNPQAEWIVDAYASLRGAAMHPIVQVVNASDRADAIAKYTAKLAAQGYAVGKLIRVEEQRGTYSQRSRKRRKNPTKAQVKDAAKKIAKRAASLAWRATKAGGRVAGRSARAAGRSAAADVKAAICRPRGKNPRRRRRRNPSHGHVLRKGAIVIRAQQGITRLYYDGKHFSSKNRAKIFDSVTAAAIVARRLLKTFPVLRNYKVAIFKA